MYDMIQKLLQTQNTIDLIKIMCIDIAVEILI